MIPFLRKTRKKLLSEDKTTSYLLYAIGEIFLVVVGILIALQINNWNEDRKQRNLEIKYLKNIQSDILIELKKNDEMISLRGLKAKCASELLRSSPPKNLAELYVIERKFETIYFWAVFIPSNNTFKELMSSGSLNTISNDSIKYYLMELDEIHLSLSNNEQHMRREYEEYLYDVFIPNTEILNFLDFENIKEGQRLNRFDTTGIATKITAKKIELMISQYDWILKNQTLRNGLKLTSMNSMALQLRHYNVKKNLERLNELITQEIKP